MTDEEIAKPFGSTWKKLIEVGRIIENEKENIANTMTIDQYYNIKGTIDYIVPHGVPDPNLFNAQLDVDLMGPPHYRLFDAIGMGMGGRYGDDPDTLMWITTLAKAYIGCVEEIKVKTRKELYDCVEKQALKYNLF